MKYEEPFTVACGFLKKWAQSQPDEIKMLDEKRSLLRIYDSFGDNLFHELIIASANEILRVWKKGG